MPKARKSKTKTTDMSTGEATVASLLAHGLKTVYALPGVHNDHLFDAFHAAADRLAVVHTRHEQEYKDWVRKAGKMTSGAKGKSEEKGKSGTEPD